MQIEALMQTYQLNQAPLLVAVSGGVDSMVLLTLLAHSRYHDQLHVAHFNHHLRAVSDQEAIHVQVYAAQLGVPITIGEWQTPDSSEAKAREARYRFLRQTSDTIGAQAVILAHHQDDQIESVLLRLARSGKLTSVRGLLPERTVNELRLLRPLLTISKQTLRNYAATHHVPFDEDESNQDTAFVRNHLRQTVVPALKQVSPQLGEHVTRLSTDLDGVLALAQAQSQQLQATYQLSPTQIDWRQLRHFPDNVQKIVLTDWLQHFAPTIKTHLVAQILAGLNQTERANLRYPLTSTHELTLSYGVLTVTPKTVITTEVMTIDRMNQFYAVADGQIGLFTQPPAQAQVLATWTGQLPVTLRHRQPGDVLHLRNGEHQLLRRFWINHKVPAHEREKAWLITRAQQVLGGQTISQAELFPPDQTDIIQAVLAFMPDS